MSITSVVNDVASSVSIINAQKPLPPTISGYSVGGVDDTALDPAGGQTVQINGTGFLAGATITFDGNAVAVVTFVNANQLTFTSPAKSAGTYTIYVVNADGGTAIYIPGIIYSVLPTWTTSAGTLGSYYETTSISNTVVASGDAPITYSLFSGSLPTGSTLYANGLITGTAPVDSSSTTYSFTIQATDAQLQDSTRSFSLTINVDAVTWVSPANATTYTSTANSAISTVTLSATDAAGYAVSYSANALPTGLSLTGSNISGTPTVIADSSTLLTATAATTNRTAVRTINWSITVANDVYFEYNTLLIPGASTTFVDDASTNNFAVTIFGDTKPNNFNPYTPGYYSNYFDGTGDYLSVPTNAALTLGAGDFTIECWFYITGNSAVNPSNERSGQLITKFQDTSNYYALYVYGNGSTTGTAIRMEIGVSGAYTTVQYTGTIAQNQWHHVASVRNGSGSNNVTIYLNGISVATGTNTATDNNTGPVNIGYYGYPSYPNYFNGYISNARIVKGTAVYTSNFTPSTTPLTAITNTGLLTCQSNRFIDNSTNNFTLTVNGNTSINSFQPFTPNSSYSTYGSGYFDGTGDYLTAPSSSAFDFGTGDFTFEAWVYPTAFPTYGGITSRGTGAGPYSPFRILLNSGKAGFFCSSSGSSWAVNILSASAVSLNAWTHIACVRSSTTFTLYVNGASVGTATGISSSLMASSSVVAIGSNGGTDEPFAGYITDTRFVKGTAVYTTTFTPPSAPLTAIANTSLLTLQNNQSVNNNIFLDNSTNNFFVTRNGNTTQGTFSPYGGNWSNYFDGTGDYLTTATNAAFAFGTGDFTMECWFSTTTLGVSQKLITFYPVGSLSGYNAIFIDVGNTVSYGANGGANITSSGTITRNTWYHLAAVRLSGTTKLYLNGTQVGSNYTDSTSYLTSRPAIGTDGYSLNTNNFYGYISNLRVVKGVGVYTGAFTPSTSSLTPTQSSGTNIAAISNGSTSLLTCQSNRIVDTSINNFTITKTGDTSVQRFSPFNPSSLTPTSYSGYFDGTGDYLTVPDNVALQFGTGAFTMELWFYPTATISSQILLAKGTGGDGFELRSRSSGGGNYFSFWTANGGTAIVESNVTFTLNTWQHLAVVRSSGTMTLYKNGVNVGSASDSTSFVASGSALRVAVDVTAGNLYSTGYISNVRIVKGVAVYTGAFTPPTSPLSATQSSGTNIAAITGTSTSLLTLQSTTFIDNSTNNFTVSAFGNSQPTIQNPFGFTSATTNGYTVSTIGGSGYFDGTGDYLTVPSTTAFNMGTDNFTIEGWVYMTVYSAGSCLFGTTNGSTAGYYINLGADLNTFRVVSNASGTWADIITASAGNGIPLNQWVHVAFVRNGANITLYKNGISVATSSGASAYNFTSPTNAGYVGFVTNGVSTQYFTGYIGDLRIIKGTALYTSNFVPPSAPVVALQNSSLLLNMTSAGIYDAAMMNNMETVGDAKLSTAISKFGSGSMSFDGNGDYLSMPANPTNRINTTGNFTIEFWAYFNTVASDQRLIAWDNNSSNFVIAFYTTTSGVLYYYLSSTSTSWNIAAVVPMGNISATTWTHIAFVRNGSVFTPYINGIAGTTTTSSATLTASTLPFVIGAAGNGTSPFNGYMDDFRMTPGIARYTSNFTPATSAFPIY